MLTTGPIAPYNFIYLRLRKGRIVEPASPNLRCLLATSRHKHKCQFAGKHLQLYSAACLPSQNVGIANKIMAVPSGTESGSRSPLPFNPFSGGWNAWILGILVSVILPFSRSKWGPLLKMKDNFESVVESAGNVAETVEKVAEEVEELSEKIAENLPEGGKLKEVVTYVETIAKEADKDAELVETIIHKVEVVEKEAVESLIDQASAATEEKKKAN